MHIGNDARHDALDDRCVYDHDLGSAQALIQLHQRSSHILWQAYVSDSRRQFFRAS